MRGVVRLISSTSTTLANTGPGTNRNSPCCWSYTLMPVRSLGSRSGVAWMRLNSPPIERASARASVVLPTPGTPSSSRLPSASRQIAAVSTASVLPAITQLDVVDETPEGVTRVAVTHRSGRGVDHAGSFDPAGAGLEAVGYNRSARVLARALIASITVRCARIAVTSAWS